MTSIIHVVAYADDFISGGISLMLVRAHRIFERLLCLAVDHAVRIHAAMLDDISNNLALLVAERVCRGRPVRLKRLPQQQRGADT
ncbi:MAG: hypothetical protein ACRDTN_08115 [Mycobacterium sp.]